MDDHSGNRQGNLTISALDEGYFTSNTIQMGQDGPCQLATASEHLSMNGTLARPQYCGSPCLPAGTVWCEPSTAAAGYGRHIALDADGLPESIYRYCANIRCFATPQLFSADPDSIGAGLSGSE